MVKITPSIQKFILNWSGIAANWGLNRTMAQIHALLLVSKEPLTADEIKAALQVARSNVSVSLRELQNWGLVQIVQVMGDRKKRYEAHKDMKLMFKQIMVERKKREVGSALKCMSECSHAAKSGPHDSTFQNQVNELTHVFERLEAFYGRLIDEV
jgi:DNA-binding transcriptional regulator GbsR (MarR family)